MTTCQTTCTSYCERIGCSSAPKRSNEEVKVLQQPTMFLPVIKRGVDVWITTHVKSFQV